MDESVGEWIRNRRGVIGMRRREDLAGKTGLGLSTVLRAETGKKVGRATMVAIGNALKIDGVLLADWADGLINEREFLERVSGRDRGGMKLPPAGDIAGRKGTPIIGEITAGGLVESMVFDNADGVDRVPISYDPADRVYALRIKGDSMLPQYRDGQVLILQDARIDDVEDGEEVVLQFDGAENGRSTFKRCVFVGDGRIKLVPLNPAYPPCEKLMENVVRVGRVLGVYEPKARLGRKWSVK